MAGITGVNWRKQVERLNNSMSKLIKIARELLLIEEDLPHRLDYTTAKHKVTADDFELFTFEQLWGSGTLGFGGAGGSVITSANTYVLVPATCDQQCIVYFGGRFAYKADYCEEFKKDLLAQNMASVANANKYKK